MDISGGGQPQAAAAEEKPAAQGPTPLEQARSELEKTESGRQVLADMDAMTKNNGLQLDERVMDGRLGQFDPATNTVSVNPANNGSPNELAQTLAHEVTHASQKFGLNPGRDGQTRDPASFNNADSYARHMVELEARAEARAIDFANETSASTGNRLQGIYNDAVKNAGGDREAGVRAVTDAIVNRQEWPDLYNMYRDWHVNNLPQQQIPPAATDAI